MKTIGIISGNELGINSCLLSIKQEDSGLLLNMQWGDGPTTALEEI